ncbi:uncharacterized protein NP_4260A [Natronomonas pharaonis DSM 2160]|uniref:Uncharacterized protein n=1 Tax=Natronomonas pharaonis (strain ATCC 35678 / DSM 2160 / CIP 103997 / JCM 8858 / NBRC 14720 / NCIMB 2260 / Gabara) TaxID=348780 RepID=A0A1U7EYE0_NATPD|nr:rod-determining factor RdfA [Natronomonas pharaonis]CAI50221.1 uncharacterized protein NP_4260A [Natronomonas pharaonis DSM 2160]
MSEPEKKSSEAERESSRGRRSKVARLLDDYDMAGVGAELERQWTADEDRMSLRDLASYFNRQLLQQRLEAANVRPVDGEVANIYRILTDDDDVAEADKTRVRRRLERDGIDVETLENDFVTYQAIRTYLKSYRGAEYSPDETDPIEREITNLQKLRGRVDAATTGKLEQLGRSGDLDIGAFRTLVDIRVVCEDCGTQYEAVELLERGGCDCAQ